VLALHEIQAHIDVNTVRHSMITTRPYAYMCLGIGVILTHILVHLDRSGSAFLPFCHS
jgi:hypothetical protein